MTAAAGSPGQPQSRCTYATQAACAANRGGDGTGGLAALGDHAVEARITAIVTGNHRGSRRRRTGTAAAAAPQANTEPHHISGPRVSRRAAASQALDRRRDIV